MFIIFFGLFSKKDRKHFLGVSIKSYIRKTCESLGGLEKAVETLACLLVFPQHF